MKAIINGKILLPDGVVSGKALLFDRAVTGLSDTVPADCETIDAQGLYVSPGFVDVHIHGYLGEDASDGSLDGLRRMARGILQNGVTSFLPTTMTVAWEELTRAFGTADDETVAAVDLRHQIIRRRIDHAHDLILFLHSFSSSSKRC